jgi:hypothetical protein
LFIFRRDAIKPGTGSKILLIILILNNMSEIVKYKGQSLKLGTCENLYYTTYQVLKKRVNYLMHVDGNLQPHKYLNDNVFRFRFPFPDENHEKLFGEYDDFERGVLISVPKSLGVEIGHGTSFFRTDNNNRSAGPVIGFRLPCIQDESFPNSIQKFDWSNTANQTIFEVVQQKLVGKELQTVVRCPYCGQLCRLSKKEAENIAEYVTTNKEQYTKLIQDIAAIMIEGYYTGKDSKILTTV